MKIFLIPSPSILVSAMLWIMQSGSLVQNAKAQCEVPSACNPKINKGLVLSSRKERVEAMKSCLQAVSRPVKDNLKLYTYGNPKKIKAMQSLSQEEFWKFSSSFTATREERAFLNFTGKGATLAQVEGALKIHSKSYDLNDVLKIYKENIEDKEIKFMAKLAAHEKIYPGVLAMLKQMLEENGDKDGMLPENMRKNRNLTFFDSVEIQKKIEQTTDDPLLRKVLEGRLTANNLSSYGYDSTGGNGIYLSENPVQSLDHLEKDGKGLVCEVDKKKKMIPLDDSCVAQALDEAQITVPSLMDRQGDAFILRPQGKNLFLSPKDFEEAAEGTIVTFRPSKLSENEPPYYLEKKAIDFSKCRLIRVSDFHRCEDFQKILARPSFPDFLMEDKSFSSIFFGSLKKCLGNCEKEDQLGLMKNVFRNSDGHVELQKFLSNKTKKLSSAINKCGCQMERKNYGRLINYLSGSKNGFQFTCRSLSKCGNKEKVTVFNENLKKFFEDVDKILFKQLSAKK